MKPMGTKQSPCGHQRFNGSPGVGLVEGERYRCKRCKRWFIYRLVPASDYMRNMLHDPSLMKIQFEEVAD